MSDWIQRFAYLQSWVLLHYGHSSWRPGANEDAKGWSASRTEGVRENHSYLPGGFSGSRWYPAGVDSS